MEEYNRGIQKMFSAFNNGGVRGYHFPLAKISEQEILTSEQIATKCTQMFYECNGKEGEYERFFTDYSPMRGLLSQWRAEQIQTVSGLYSTLDFCLELEKPEVLCVPDINKHGTMYPVFILSNGTKIDLNKIYEFWRQDCEECRFTVKILVPWLKEQEFIVEPDVDFYGKYIVESKSVFPTTFFSKIIFGC